MVVWKRVVPHPHTVRVQGESRNIERLRRLRVLQCPITVSTVLPLECDKRGRETFSISGILTLAVDVSLGSSRNPMSLRSCPVPMIGDSE